MYKITVIYTIVAKRQQNPVVGKHLIAGSNKDNYPQNNYVLFLSLFSNQKNTFRNFVDDE